MPLVATDPYAYTSRFGTVVGVIVASVLMYLLANRMLARRGRHLAPEMKAIVVGGILILAGHSFPWATVKGLGVQATLFADAFDVQLLYMLAVVVIVAALVSAIWDIPMLQASFLVLAIGAAILAAFTGFQYTHADRPTILAAFADKGPPIVAKSLHLTLDRATALTARVASASSTRTDNAFGPWVLVAGAVLAAGASAMTLLGGFRSMMSASRRRADRRVPTSGSPRGGTLQRGYSSPSSSAAWPSAAAGPSVRTSPHAWAKHSTQAVRVPPANSMPKPAPVPADASVPASSATTAEGGHGTVPAAPPMPVAPTASAPASRRSPRAVEGQWAADAAGKVARKRVRGRRR